MIKFIRKIALFLLCLTLTACVSPKDRTKAGAIAQYSEEQIREKIIIGQSTKKDVLKLIGRPSLPAEYNEANSWIYVSKIEDWRTYLIIRISLDKKAVLGLVFDDDNVVKKIIYSKS